MEILPLMSSFFNIASITRLNNAEKAGPLVLLCSVLRTLTPSPSQSSIFRKNTCTEHDCTVTPPSPLQFVKSSLSTFQYTVLQLIYLFFSHLI